MPSVRRSSRQTPMPAGHLGSITVLSGRRQDVCCLSFTTIPTHLRYDEPVDCAGWLQRVLAVSLSVVLSREALPEFVHQCRTDHIQPRQLSLLRRDQHDQLYDLEVVVTEWRKCVCQQLHKKIPTLVSHFAQTLLHRNIRCTLVVAPLVRVGFAGL